MLLICWRLQLTATKLQQAGGWALWDQAGTTAAAALPSQSRRWHDTWTCMQWRGCSQTCCHSSLFIGK